MAVSHVYALVGLCFPPLQMICLACKYFKLAVN